MSGGFVKGLDGLRALCALFILLGHVSQPDFCPWEIGAVPLPECSAYVFFAISGLLAGYREDSLGGVLAYYKKKARRLLPLYYSYLVLSVLVFSVWGRWNEILDYRLLYYLFLVPQIPFCSQTGILPLVHLWFVGVLVLFYFLFPLFLRVRENKRKEVAFVVSVIWLLLKLALRVFAGTDSFLYRIVGVTSFDVLFAGVWVGLLLKGGNPLIERLKNWPVIGLLAGLMYFGSGFYGRLIPAPVRVDYIAMLALAFIVSQQRENPVPNLENKFWGWLGSISYEIYVTQILVIILLSWAYSRAGLDFPSFVIYSICVAAVIGVAWCFHQALNLRNTRRLRQLAG